eukprot:3230093-Amphidinium_carterae.1
MDQSDQSMLHLVNPGLIAIIAIGVNQKVMSEINVCSECEQNGNQSQKALYQIGAKGSEIPAQT